MVKPDECSINIAQKTVTTVTLNDCVTIQAGYPFRGAIHHEPSGSVKAVQAKDMSDFGVLIYDDLIVTELTGKREANWLQQGDVLFNAKGAKHIACYVDKHLENTTCSPSLFLLRIKQEYANKVDGLYLTWQINQPPIQNYLKRSAEGSYQLSIRKPILEEASIAMPDIETQRTIGKLYMASIKENSLLEQLKINRQKQLHLIAADLIKDSKNESY